MHALENLPAEQQHIHAEATQPVHEPFALHTTPGTEDRRRVEKRSVNHRFGISNDLSTSAMLHADLKCGGVTEQVGAAVTVPPD